MLPPKNTNKGALLIEQLELYIHDVQEEIKGSVGIYKASYESRGFQCESPNPRVQNIFVGFEPYGSFRSEMIHKEQLLKDRQRQFCQLQYECEEEMKNSQLKMAAERKLKACKRQFDDYKDLKTDAFVISGIDSGMQVLFRIPSQVRQVGK